MQHWSFSSTDDGFDGDRVQREARDSGIDIVRVTRRESSIVLCTLRFHDRLIAAKVPCRTLQRNSYGLALCLCREALATYVQNSTHCSPQESYHVRLANDTDVGALFVALVAAEDKPPRTTVTGYP